jgi:hypothetical protein
MKANLRATPELLLSFRVGAIGGAVCGIIILSFASLTGHSGTTGSEYVGAWDWGVLGLGLLYGSFFGILLAPLGHVIFLKRIGFKKAILPAFAGTILGGLFGALSSPLGALFYGCLGFFSALTGLRFSLYFREKATASGKPDRRIYERRRKKKRK